MLSQLTHFFPSEFDRYFEPFVGGGAVFFHLQPREAYLSDANFELITTYRTIKENVHELVLELKKLQDEKLTSELYDKFKKKDPTKLSPIKCATRFIFLNKTCYNGLYRVNRKGEFNVPMGRYDNMPTLFDETNLERVAKLLATVHIDLMDYEIAAQRARSGDLVYLDPPYLPEPGTNGFTSYTKEAFTRADEEKLLKSFKELDRRGCLVMLSNSANDYVRSTFSEYQDTIFELQAGRMINSVGAKRTGFKELLITNYEPPVQTLMQWVRRENENSAG
jgi:DNA adenine methylase